MKEAEKRFSQIVQGLSIATFVIDADHVLTHCNKAFENLTGLPAESLIGTRNQWKAFYPVQRSTLADFIVNQTSSEEMARHYGDKYAKSALIEGAYEAEDFFPNLTGGGKWLFFTAAPLMDEDGRIIGAIETLQDITDRKHTEQALRKSERRLRALLDFEPYPVVVFTLEGKVAYLNPAFTEIFGWTLEELEGQRIPYVPPGLEEETRESIKKFLEDRVILRYESQRLTKDGRLLDVVIRAAIFSISKDEPAGQIVIVRDITREKRIARNNQAMLQISMALPEYPDLEDLLYFINSEVKSLLATEGAIAILHDELKSELFITGAAYDDMDTQKRAEEIRFPMDQLVAGRVIKTGEPMIVSDTSQDRELHEERDRKLGYKTKNLILVPLRSHDRIIGVLCGVNKKKGVFDQSDVDLLSMIAGTAVLSIENARVTEELKKAYREVTSLNRAKDKAINHLSHELKTPIAILMSSVKSVSKKMETLPGETWKPPIERIKRNLQRLLEIQYEVDDILEGREQRTHQLLSFLLDQCSDELAALVGEETGQESLVEKIKGRIDRLFGPRQAVSEELSLDRKVGERIDHLRTLFPHREIELVTRLEPTPLILIPSEVLEKVIDGLIKNAVENTPDGGKVEVLVRKKGEGALLVVHDYGVGITEEAQKWIFEGFFTTRDTMAYSTGRPFDFQAGGKGADLLRMRILSERYHFQIGMTSTRCGYIPREEDICPGRISRCRFCTKVEDCYQSGETTFSVYFPPVGKPLSLS